MKGQKVGFPKQGIKINPFIIRAGAVAGSRIKDNLAAKSAGDGRYLPTDISDRKSVV